MKIIIYVLYLIAPTVIGLTIYYWSSTFKALAITSDEEFNEDEVLENDRVSLKEAKTINFASHIIFIIIGVFLWCTMGITIGRIASIIAPNNFLKLLVYFLTYFVFLRFPFGIGNKMVKRRFDLEELHEKTIFAISMVASFIMSICCYDSIPQFLKWQLYFVS